MFTNKSSTVILSILGVVVVILLVLGVRGKGGLSLDTVTASSTQATSTPIIQYMNTEYGFTFDLPEDWNNYSIVKATWQGTAMSQGYATSGPTILIRNPSWTQSDPHQDIPIMVFTMAQWDDMQKERFHIGAAPINPTELGRNTKYVFALPARYNYAYQTGWEDVEQIMKGNPLRPF